MLRSTTGPPDPRGERDPLSEETLPGAVMRSPSPLPLVFFFWRPPAPPDAPPAAPERVVSSSEDLLRLSRSQVCARGDSLTALRVMVSAASEAVEVMVRAASTDTFDGGSG